ncbi:RNA polymerase sigma-70 factor (ECF subfamily) [Methylohalomonas lacus]|uniref:RNA polymerase sigma-70 factor (ECF subfamily) n=1 Tax=Methylohalomonas lacus TaxID=398773 RepID=A0AAE3L532_9GAMM|nr:RNA polymerase sigma factor [Methylohalomonas lacus]MCS3902577.1 RNA polymerase sigma-70 factor (ECF subfamily) [Methylohalomonas lacus]
MASPEDTIDLDALRAGDQAVFAELIRRYHTALLGLVRPMVGDAHAEEVVQEAWIKAHKHCSRFAGRSTIKTWLCSIAVNEARMQLRHDKRESELRMQDSSGEDPYLERFNSQGSWSSPPAAWQADSPEALLAQGNLADCLEKTLTQLPGNQQALIQLRDIDGEAFETICNELALSASNARVLLHRARGALYRMLEHYEETGEC